VGESKSVLASKTSPRASEAAWPRSVRRDGDDARAWRQNLSRKIDLRPRTLLIRTPHARIA
jgi:hypothetical protein